MLLTLPVFGRRFRGWHAVRPQQGLCEGGRGVPQSCRQGKPGRTIQSGRACTRRAGAFLRTTRRPLTGIAWRRSRGTCPLNRCWGSCTSGARGYAGLSAGHALVFQGSRQRLCRGSAQSWRHVCKRAGSRAGLQTGHDLVSQGGRARSRARPGNSWLYVSKRTGNG